MIEYVVQHEQEPILQQLEMLYDELIAIQHEAERTKIYPESALERSAATFKQLLEKLSAMDGPTMIQIRFIIDKIQEIQAIEYIEE